MPVRLWGMHGELPSFVRLNSRARCSFEVIDAPHCATAALKAYGLHQGPPIAFDPGARPLLGPRLLLLRLFPSRTVVTAAVPGLGLGPVAAAGHPVRAQQ